MPQEMTKMNGGVQSVRQGAMEAMDKVREELRERCAEVTELRLQAADRDEEVQALARRSMRVRPCSGSGGFICSSWVWGVNS